MSTPIGLFNPEVFFLQAITRFQVISYLMIIIIYKQLYTFNKILLSKTNNLQTLIWLSAIIPIWYTIICFQVFPSNINNLQTIKNTSQPF